MIPEGVIVYTHGGRFVVRGGVVWYRGDNGEYPAPAMTVEALERMADLYAQSREHTPESIAINPALNPAAAAEAVPYVAAKRTREAWLVPVLLVGGFFLLRKLKVLR